MRRTLSGLLLLLSAAAAHVLAAQADSTARDSVHVVAPDPLILPKMLGAFVLLATAPPLILFTPGMHPGSAVDTGEVQFAEQHADLYGTVDFGHDDNDQSLRAHSEDLELFHHGFYAEGAVNQWYFVTRHVQTERFGIGYLVQPQHQALGGIVLGYRGAQGASLLRGVQIGLPFLLSNERGTIRFEPSYLVSGDGVCWNYRWQADAPIGHTPLLLGMRAEAQTVGRRGQPSAFTFAAVVGLRANRGNSVRQ